MNENELTRHQQAFLQDIAVKIKRLLDVAEQGSRIAYFRLGTRAINGKQVVLKLVIEDVPDEQQLPTGEN